MMRTSESGHGIANDVVPGRRDMSSEALDTGTGYARKAPTYNAGLTEVLSLIHI